MIVENTKENLEDSKRFVAVSRTRRGDVEGGDGIGVEEGDHRSGISHRQ
jgi:hypothetical protein